MLSGFSMCSGVSDLVALDIFVRRAVGENDILVLGEELVETVGCWGLYIGAVGCVECLE